MIKYRSWNEELRQFFYWEDGIYQRCGVDREEFCIGLFNWQNAEQGFTREGVTFFEGDKFKLDSIYYGIVVFREGVLEFEIHAEGFDLKDFTELSYYSMDKLEKLGNIHEGSKDENK